MSQFETAKKRLKFLPTGIIVLTVLTAVIHLFLAFVSFWMVSTGAAPAGSTPQVLLLFGILFLLNGIGYLALVAALYMSRFQRFQRIIRWLLIGFTVLTIVLWYVIEASNSGLFEYSDKLIEVLLVVLLLIEDWQMVNKRRSSLTQINEG